MPTLELHTQTNLRRAPWGVYVVQLDDTFTTVLPAKTSNIVGGNLSVPSKQIFLEGGGVFYHAQARMWYLTSGRNGCMDPRGGDVRVWRYVT